MPSLRLGRRESVKHEIVATQRKRSGIIHVGLLAKSMTLEENVAAPVRHMGPPLDIDPASDMQAHIVAWLPLTREEEEAIDVWLIDMSTKRKDCHYIALPDAKTLRNEQGKITGWFFSCAGFVRTAYLAAEIDLVNGKALPLVNLATVEKTWPIIRTQDRSSLGLAGSGPWQIVLPSYIIDALNQGRSKLPFTPI